MNNRMLQHSQVATRKLFSVSCTIARH
uniref:Uncharacterized protein n=1 Tax=Anguilla anguilla TaxID=7936 RepID=A0A0E9TZ24_ANGAN